MRGRVHSPEDGGSAVFASSASHSQVDEAQDTQLSSAVDHAMAGSSVVNALDDYSFTLWCSKRTRIVLPCISLASRLRLQAWLDSSWTTLFFLLLTIYSLFIIDTLQLAMDADAEQPIFWSLLGVVVAFSVELVRAAQKLPRSSRPVFNTKRRHGPASPGQDFSCPSFGGKVLCANGCVMIPPCVRSYRLDTLATVSIALSIPFSQLIERNCNEVDSTSLAFAQAGRTVRLVRQGGRALRVLRVLRIVQLFRFFRWIAVSFSVPSRPRLTHVLHPQ